MNEKCPACGSKAVEEYSIGYDGCGICGLVWKRGTGEVKEAEAKGVELDKKLELAISAIKYPNGPEDKLLEKYDLDWDILKDFAEKKEWTLSSKLAQCLLDMGGLAEELVERMTYFKIVSEDLTARLALQKSALKAKVLAAIPEKRKVDYHDPDDIGNLKYNKAIAEITRALNEALGEDGK